jgi:hypothetical protein
MRPGRGNVSKRVVLALIRRSPMAAGAAAGAVFASLQSNRKGETMAKTSSVDQLNSFLRGELSAIETYRMALDKLDRATPARAELEANMSSHQDRVVMLRDAILQLGGTPSESSGPWGVFAKAVEGSARVMGDKIAISALEEGEDHGLADYRRGLDQVDLSLQALVRERLIPLQKQSHDRLSLLKHRLS